jgi:hypothetical protein
LLKIFSKASLVIFIHFSAFPAFQGHNGIKDTHNINSSQYFQCSVSYLIQSSSLGALVFKTQKNSLNAVHKSHSVITGLEPSPLGSLKFTGLFPT